MFYHYKFWHSLKNPTYFTNIVEKGEIIGYKKRALTVFILFILLFAAREYWGMGTENLTSLFAMDLQNEYYVARVLSMLGAIYGQLFILLPLLRCYLLITSINGHSLYLDKKSPALCCCLSTH
ncbi:hypothetical protein [Lysinibacillus sphaericus]|uniref:hypothetical protein n=1 Tax=Lysinibacillus sphaericus TaxID=1421 RepID=UPI000A9F3CD9|nr:hypothetical protein [Lysinibacillus sphaericus]